MEDKKIVIEVRDHGEMEPSSNRPLSSTGQTSAICDNTIDLGEPAPRTTSKPHMDLREFCGPKALWNHVSNTKRLYDQMNQPPAALRAFLKLRHKFTDEQFFYLIDMIRDRQDQEMGR
tara:strand:- start:3608 stop:3961 length:354 start_codon:yes stop_codon:yes gene_type:complete